MVNPNINQDHQQCSKEENLIPPERIKKEYDAIESMEIGEISPKLEKTEVAEEPEEPEEMENHISDPIFDNLRNLKICNQCGIQAVCIIENKENGQVAYYCTEKCMLLNSYKAKSRFNHPQLNLQPSTSSATAMKLNDPESLYVRVCSTCSAIIQVHDYSNISWQARDFCNEKCLTKHQVRFNAYCIECKTSIVDSNNFGKFSMKFGNNVRTFCSKLCLDKYKISLNMCQFCNNDISKDAHHKYLAPVSENSSTFKQFCSIVCVKNYCHYKLKLPYQNEGDNIAICAICNALKFVEVKFQHKDIKTYMFCSENCYIKFQSYNRTEAVQCSICKILYEKIFFQRYCLYDNGVKNFCSQSCQTTYYIVARHIVDCQNCRVKKYNFDMIQKTFPNNQTIYACSFECLKNSYKNMSRPILSSGSQSELKRLYGNLKNLMTLTIARNGALSNKKNASTLCYPNQNDATTSTEYATVEKGTQTIIPASGPSEQISLPFPVAIPIPIPVPIFIPTSCKTQEELTMKMNKILQEVPQDPLQADLILMAKTLTTSGVNIQKKKPLQSRRKPKKPLKNKLVKKVYNFGVFTLKRWIITTNAKTGNSLKTNILYMTRDELQNCLMAFLKNMKRSHSPGTVYSIFLDIQRYLLHKNKQEYIFLDVSFKNFIEQFNEITIGFHAHKINTKLSEDYLWKTNQLGSHTPYTLLNSLIYFNLKLFGIKTVQEHLDLLSMQVTFSKKPILNLPDSKLKYAYRLKYFPKKEDGKKVSEMDKNFFNQKRCPGFLYEFYAKKCPTKPENGSNRSFYLQPELASETDSPIWFSNQALDGWTIEMMLNRIKMVKEINQL